jgi:hypothetical protein
MCLSPYGRCSSPHWNDFNCSSDWNAINSGQVALRAILIYALALLLVRIGSKRVLGQATAFDVIVAIMLGSVLSRAINGSAPFVPTILASGALVGLHLVFVALAVSTSLFGPLRLLIKDGKVQEEEMRAANLYCNDLDEALRSQSHKADPSKIKRAFWSATAASALFCSKRSPASSTLQLSRGLTLSYQARMIVFRPPRSMSTREAHAQRPENRP